MTNPSHHQGTTATRPPSSPRHSRPSLCLHNALPLPQTNLYLAWSRTCWAGVACCSDSPAAAAAVLPSRPTHNTQQGSLTSWSVFPFPPSFCTRASPITLTINRAAGHPPLPRLSIASHMRLAGERHPPPDWLESPASLPVIGHLTLSCLGLGLALYTCLLYECAPVCAISKYRYCMLGVTSFTGISNFVVYRYRLFGIGFWYYGVSALNNVKYYGFSALDAFFLSNLYDNL